MKLVIFIPAYNEEKTIVDVINSIPRLKEFNSQQVIVIDDGSSDKTFQLAAKTDAVIYTNQVNRGLGFTFQLGVQKALEHGADIMVTLDADGQFPANRIGDIVFPILNNKAEMVTATRFLHKADYPENIGWVKYFGNQQVAWLMTKIVGQRFSDVSCGFRAYSKEALLKINLYGRFTYTQEVMIDLAMKNIKIIEIPVKVKYFKKRDSRIFKNGFNYAFKSLWIIFRTYRDFAPLRVFGTVGIILFIIGLMFDLILLRHYLMFRVFTPYQFAGFLGAFFNVLGIAFVIVGLVTDMLVRIRMNQENILYQLKMLKAQKPIKSKI